MSKRVDNINEEDDKTEAKKADDTTKHFLVYPLAVPIKAYGDEVSVIKMNRPSGEDLLAVGNPVVYFPHTDPIRIEHDLQKVVQMVARISDPKIPTTSLAKLDPRDLNGIAWAISPFFIPAN